MTAEEISNLRFTMTSHMSMEDEHVSTYVCKNAPDGHVIKIFRHVEINMRSQKAQGVKYDKYDIDGYLYKSLEEFKQKLLEL